LGSLFSGLENTLKKHAVVSSGPSFSGKGHTLGGAPAGPDVVGEAKNVYDGVAARFDGLDPQMKVLFLLLGLYGLFYYYS